MIGRSMANIFTPHHTSGAARTGKLLDLMPTPNFFLYSQRGAPHYLTPDLVDTLDVSGVHVVLPHLLPLKAPTVLEAQGIAGFGCLHPLHLSGATNSSPGGAIRERVVFADCRDPLTHVLSTSNNKDVTVITASNGKARVTPADLVHFHALLK
jgi:hypothetical protein